MNVAKQKARELRNKERADERAASSRPTSLRSEIERLKTELKGALETVKLQSAALDSMYSEQAATSRIWGDLAVQLRDYGIIFSVEYGRATISEVNWVARPVPVRRMASAPSQDIVNGRQRQIVLDEEA
jgi:hypothetical protein